MTYEKGNLEKHIKAFHEKIRDKKCPHCDHMTSEKGNLEKHIKAVHEKIRDK
jgi:hypothetical protein